MYELLLDYMDDVYAFRKEAPPATFEDMIKNVRNMDDAVNRLTGKWLYFSNNDITRLIKKYGADYTGTKA